MSYTRVLDSGRYIYSDGTYLHFDNVEVPNDDIDIFLAKLYDLRKEEFHNRVQHGRDLIEQFKSEVSLDE